MSRGLLPPPDVFAVDKKKLLEGFCGQSLSVGGDLCGMERRGRSGCLHLNSALPEQPCHRAESGVKILASGAGEGSGR